MKALIHPAATIAGQRAYLFGRRADVLIGGLFAVLVTLGALIPAVAAERSIRDASGREVAIGAAQRIVTIGSDVTEIVYALGAADRVIARDQTSTYPHEALQKPDVGYMRALSAEGVLSVRPDLILAVEGAGPRETIELLKAASVPIVMVPEHHSASGIGDKVRMVAEVLGKRAEGEALAAGIEAKFAALDPALAALAQERRKKVVFFLSLAGDKPVVGGAGTSADAIIGLAGGINALGAADGFKPSSDEALAAAAPDVVLMMRRGPEPAATPETVFKAPALASTPAARTKSLVVMDGQYLLGFGPRTADAARDLAAALYPDLALPPKAAE